MPAAKIQQHLGTGRRKTAIARIFLRPGKGDITINGRTLENYFPTEAFRVPVRQALLVAEMADKFDLLILAHGGGIAGQADAIRLGVARALVEFNGDFARNSRKPASLPVILVSMSARSTVKRALASGSSSPNASRLDLIESGACLSGHPGGRPRSLVVNIVVIHPNSFSAGARKYRFGPRRSSWLGHSNSELVL